MADYSGQSDTEGRFPAAVRRIFNSINRPDNADLPIELKRVHSTYEKREEQIEINLLAVTGGSEYVHRRLTRFSGESNIDWRGGQRADGGKVEGRKQQSHCFPYAGRIINKISQHVFSTAPTRDNCPANILNDASADGSCLNDIMRQANDYVTACGWCWIGIDAPSVTEQISEAQKVERKIRPYMQVYSPLSVVDWKFDSIGDLEWLITESEECESFSIGQNEMKYELRRIWTKGMVRTVKIAENERGKKTVISDFETTITYQGIPFILVGNISAGGYAFDDIESVNRSIMDLESVNRANFFKRCYPQLVIPVSCIENVSDAYGTTGAQAAELIVGMNYPILISKDDPAPFYLTPSASDMGALRTELEKLKSNMFEAVGLMLQNESRQVASAESKAWDYLDVAMVMRSRAAILEDAENKAAKIMNRWDSSIPAWVSSYNRQFDIGDFSQEMNALIMAVNTSMPDELYRLILSKILDRLDRVGASVTSEQRKEIEDAILVFSPNSINMDFGGDIAAEEPTEEDLSATP